MTTTRLLLVRHGETDWARDRRHTGRTDVPLNETGRHQAAALSGHLPLTDVVAVWTSPLSRAAETARLAGLAVDRTDDDLLEWDYGAAEGRTTAEIRETHPGWDVWDEGVAVLGADGSGGDGGGGGGGGSDGRGGDEAPGETLDQVGVRVDRVIARARELPGTVVLVAHAHVLRVLAARWLGLPPVAGRHLTLDPAGWAILAWERDTPVIDRWNPPKP